MLDDSETLDLTNKMLTDPWRDLSDGSDSGMDCKYWISIQKRNSSWFSSNSSRHVDSIGFVYNIYNL